MTDNIPDMKYKEDKMYSLDDKQSAIKAIQRYLKTIMSDTSIEENGIFDKDTLMLLNEYQKVKGIDISNSIGYETFTMIYEDFIRISPTLVGQTKFPITK